MYFMLFPCCYCSTQPYGLGAPRPALSSLESGGAGRPGSFGGGHSAMSMADCDDAPLLSSLEQQLKLLRRELKTKDDKIARLTEHAVMMGSHMDRLKAEVGAICATLIPSTVHVVSICLLLLCMVQAAHLTVQLRETNMELEVSLNLYINSRPIIYTVIEYQYFGRDVF